MLEQPEVKIATRNMFYDEQGKHRRTKKEILDEQGNIRAGCSIISKGEVYESHIFTKKEEWFKDKSFTKEVKELFTDTINCYVKEESEKLSVFQQGGVYLAMKKPPSGPNAPPDPRDFPAAYRRRQPGRHHQHRSQQAAQSFFPMFHQGHTPFLLPFVY